MRTLRKANAVQPGDRIVVTLPVERINDVPVEVVVVVVEVSTLKGRTRLSYRHDGRPGSVTHYPDHEVIVDAD